MSESGRFPDGSLSVAIPCHKSGLLIESWMNASKDRATNFWSIGMVGALKRTGGYQAMNSLILRLSMCGWIDSNFLKWGRVEWQAATITVYRLLTSSLTIYIHFPSIHSLDLLSFNYYHHQIIMWSCLDQCVFSEVLDAWASFQCWGKFSEPNGAWSVDIGLVIVKLSAKHSLKCLIGLCLSYGADSTNYANGCRWMAETKK